MKRKNTFIIGHYGGDNFGDEFMLEALLEYLETSQKIDKIFVVNKKDNSSSNKVTYVSPGFLSTLRVFLKTELLILGGGTHFHDDYHKKRLKRHYLYLAKILVLSFLYRVCFKKVYYLGVGYAPLNSSRIKRYTKLSLWLSSSITVRDKISFENLNYLLKKPCSPSVQLTFDLACLHSEVGRKREKSEKLVGISLTSFNFSSNMNEDSLWEDEIIPQIAAVFKKKDITIRIFVFRGGSRESDIPLSEKLKEYLDRIDSKRVAIYEHVDNTEAFIAPMAQCQYFIATRYHSAVIAYLLNCNMIIIPYHQKLVDVGDMIHLNKHAVLDLRYPEVFTVKFNELLIKDNRYRPEIPPSQNKALTSGILNQIFKSV